MEFGTKVFVITTGEVATNEIQSVISCKGVVTGYFLRVHCDAAPVKVNRKDVFTDEREAVKALFVRNLKASESKSPTPAEDKKGDRHWIKGHKRYR